MTDPVTQFLNYQEHERIASPHTVKAYRRRLQRYQDFLDSRNIPILQVSSTDIRAFLIYQSQEAEPKWGPLSISHLLTTLKSFYKFLCREELMQYNPTRPVKPPRIPHKLPEILTQKQIAKLFKLKFKTIRDKLILALLYDEALRIGELANLAISDCDLEKKEIWIRNGKGNKDRVVPMGKKVANLIRKYLQEGESQSVRLIPLSRQWIHEIVKYYLSQIPNAPTNPHSLRHSCLTHMMENGADIKALQEFAGHMNIATTEKYLHLTIKRIQEIYKDAFPRAKSKEAL